MNHERVNRSIVAGDTLLIAIVTALFMCIRNYF